MPRIAERLRIRRRRPGRGFTLLEVLIAFAIGTTLTGVIYFFYLGLIQTGAKAKERLFLNQVAEIELERIVRELQLAVRFRTLKGDEISFQRPQIDRWGDNETGFEVNMDLKSRRFENVTYRRVADVNGKWAGLERKVGLDHPVRLFTVEKLSPEIFQGWVFPRGAEENPHEVADMEVYRPNRDVKSDLERIPLVRIRFDMENGKDRIEIQTKAFIPPIYAQIVQPNWNSGN